jgi:hypothetical protein
VIFERKENKTMSVFTDEEVLETIYRTKYMRWYRIGYQVGCEDGYKYNPDRNSYRPVNEFKAAQFDKGYNKSLEDVKTKKKNISHEDVLGPYLLARAAGLIEE